MEDATAAGRGVGPDGRPPILDRRRMLMLALLAPAAAAGLGACSAGTGRRAPEPDPLVALAEAARADAALAAAAIAANPELTARVDPLRAARTAHAAALEAEVVRVGGTPAAPAPTAGADPSAPRSVPSAGVDPTGSDPTVRPTGVTQSVTLARVREALAASERGAATLVPDLPAERVGLVASVAACCATYTAVLA